jgi:hypothetical protein
MQFMVIIWINNFFRLEIMLVRLISFIFCTLQLLTPPDLSIQTEIDRLAIKQFVKQQSITKLYPMATSELNRTLVKKENISVTDDNFSGLNGNTSNMVPLNDKSMQSMRGVPSMNQQYNTTSLSIPSRSQTEKSKKKFK